MKYIRTKDGKIFLIHEDLETKDLWYFENREKTIIISCNPSDLGKVADTIEELCDGYVIEHPINAFKFFYNKEDMEMYLFNTCMRMFKLHELKVYSVIKTDKGLIYVAKMNDKGELELL